MIDKLNLISSRFGNHKFVIHVRELFSSRNNTLSDIYRPTLNVETTAVGRGYGLWAFCSFDQVLDIHYL